MNYNDVGKNIKKMEKEIIIFSERFDSLTEAAEVMRFLQAFVGSHEVSSSCHEDEYRGIKRFEARIVINTEI